ncbi:MAG: hypothetical protein JOZ24_03510 [Candidatus Eremiobacteraeota bacterium]|nr:hypothetical protein [Candidatus Eremiobacteraeota bacterium]
MKIAVSSASFRRLFAARELTQLEWLEGCASRLALDGIVAAESDFPRTDPEYVAQVRKVAVDLGLVPYAIDAPDLLDPAASPERCERVLTLAAALGAHAVRTVAAPAGEVPPAAFVEAVRAARIAAKAAKAANVTLLVAAAPDTLAADLAGLRHLLKDVDSAWLRGAVAATIPPSAYTPKERFPALVARVGDDLKSVARNAANRWLIVDAVDAERPWETIGDTIVALRGVEARARLSAAAALGVRADGDRSGHLVPG